MSPGRVGEAGCATLQKKGDTSFVDVAPRFLGKKSGGPLTPKRPAFAFLVTPKLPLGGRSVKFDELSSNGVWGTVKQKLAKSTNLIRKRRFNRE
jgi:hypothetical protein